MRLASFSFSFVRVCLDRLRAGRGSHRDQNLSVGRSLGLEVQAFTLVSYVREICQD